MKCMGLSNCLTQSHPEESPKHPQTSHNGSELSAANAGNLKLPARMLVPGLVSPRRLAGFVVLWTGAQHGLLSVLKCLGVMHDSWL